MAQGHIVIGVEELPFLWSISLLIPLCTLTVVRLNDFLRNLDKVER